MRRRTTLLVIITHFLVASCANSKDFILYKKGTVTPAVYYKHGAEPAANEFIQLFKKLGTTLVIRNEVPNDLKPYVQVEVDSKIGGFKLIQRGENGLSIIGASEKDLVQGIRYFFSTYTALNEFTYNSKELSEKVVTVPLDLFYSSNAPLAYKEPYFAENFNKEFRLWNNTNTLEETWGLWGHNIGKFIKVTPEMYAIVDGKPNEEQLNFSSTALKIALESAIREKLAEQPEANKFMIMPYDNQLVCQCEKCIQLGNTKTSASAAVYELINQLAEKFPSAFFFSTAYITTENPPKKPLKSNVGVMISTMSFPKGIVIETSNKVAGISDTLKNWQKLTKHIYLWDYAINFDNYFDAYPTVAIAQKNLQFYIKNGVTGVFMHGSDEGSFAAFGDLKAYLYAKLFNDPTIDLHYHIKMFLAQKYPSFGETLAEYYIKIENSALNSRRSFDIYGGIKQSVSKYLNQEDLNKLLSLALTKRGQVKPADRRAYESMLMSLVFQSLELMRINGIAENGYAIRKNEILELNPKVENYLRILKQLSSATGINQQNEIGFTVSDYINSWQTRIINSPTANLLHHKKIKANTTLDDDYTDISILNDGAIGFQDYYNNWLINSSPVLSLETGMDGLQKASVVEIDFLYDKKHKIYPPAVVTVFIGQRKYEQVLGGTDAITARRIVRTRIPIQTTPNDANIRIDIKKQIGSQKKLMACDEIIIR